MKILEKVVESPSLEIFKKHLYAILWIDEQGGWTRWLTVVPAQLSLILWTQPQEFQKKKSLLF